MTTPSADAPRIPWNAEHPYPFCERRRRDGARSSSATRARIGVAVSQRCHKCPELERSGDAAAYAHFSDRYRDMAKTLGFEGHIAWAEAMP